MKCCGQQVKVIKFGEGYVGTCPICRRIVYNGKDKPLTKGGSYEEAMVFGGTGSAVGGIRSNFYVRSC
jgi:hypothetical protein